MILSSKPASVEDGLGLGAPHASQKAFDAGLINVQTPQTQVSFLALILFCFFDADGDAREPDGGLGTGCGPPGGGRARGGAGGARRNDDCGAGGKRGNPGKPVGDPGKPAGDPGKRVKGDNGAAPPADASDCFVWADASNCDRGNDVGGNVGGGDDATGIAVALLDVPVGVAASDGSDATSGATVVANAGALLGVDMCNTVDVDDAARACAIGAGAGASTTEAAEDGT